MRIKIVYLLIAVFFNVTSSLKAEECEFPKPERTQVLQHNVNVLSSQEVKILQERLLKFMEQTSNQFLVAFVDSLCGYSPFEYATKLGQDWGVGREKEDNGLVILFKRRTAPGNGKVFVATGYGLEGAIPDALARRVVDNEILDELKSTGDYYAAVNRGLNVLEALAKGEYNEKDYNARLKEREKSRQTKSNRLAGILILVFVIFYLFRAKRYSSKNNVSFWAALFIASSASRGGRSGSSFSNFSSGGGGFGGFGGGGFGGGGAGGSW